jgi:hypothetical protein
LNRASQFCWQIWWLANLVGWSPGRALKFGLGWFVLHFKFGGKFGGGVGKFGGGVAKFGGMSGKFGGVVDVTDRYGGE